MKSIKGEIKDALGKVHDDGTPKNRSGWTKAYKAALTELGKKHGYMVYPDEKREEGEFLVDLCWSKESLDKWMEDFKGIALACEIEWNRDLESIIYDFQKLTVIEADIRIFIFQYDSEEEYEKFKEAIIKARQFTLVKDYKYIIAGSGNTGKPIQYID